MESDSFQLFCLSTSLLLLLISHLVLSKKKTPKEVTKRHALFFK